MSVKFGDKYLCKKTNKGNDFDIGVDENIWYEVVKIDSSPKELTAYTYSEYEIPRYIQVNDSKSMFNISFCISNQNSKSDYFWNYFYTTKELRKKKLDKIYENELESR